jgi:hypothetical protein
VFDATARYHNPVNAAAWSDPDIDASYDNVRAHERLQLEADAAAMLPHLVCHDAANLDLPLSEQVGESRYDRRLPRAGPPFDEQSRGHGHRSYDCLPPARTGMITA